MSPLELSPEALRVIEKVQKLLTLSKDAGATEHEAQVAAAMAQKLLEAHNLDMASIGHTAKGSQRSDNKLKGGLYKWQRELWRAVSELNFCMYWSIKGLKAGSTYEHRILGRQENVIGTQVMAEYLQGTVERIAQETANDRGLNIYCREMIAFREGMGERLSYRLWTLRSERLAEDKRKQREQEAAARHPGHVASNAIVLQSVIDDEHDLNNDYVHGWEPGTTAKRKRDAELWHQQAVAKRKQWELDNPEAHKAELEDIRKRSDEFNKQQERKARRRKGNHRERKLTAEEERRNLDEFNEGWHRGNDVSLNQQIKDSPAPSRRLS